jgi:hypothetical protein
MKAPALSLVIPTEARRSGGISDVADLSWKCFSTEPTRISYLATLVTTTYAALRKERRRNFINATKLDRKSGGA